MFNISDLQNGGSSGHLFYLEIESSLSDMPVESRAVPLNVLLNPTHDRLLVPAINAKNQRDQVCLYVDPTTENKSSVNNEEKFTTLINVNTTQINSKPPSSLSPAVTSNSLSGSAVKSNDKGNSISNQEYTSRLKSASRDNIKEKEKCKIKGFVPIIDRDIPPRAIAVLPPVLHMRRETITPRRSLPERVRFGPVEGVTRTISFSAAYGIALNAAKSKTPVFLLHNGDNVLHIDVSDKDKSNWFSLLPLGTKYTANVWLYQEDNKLYGITVESIDPGTPLALGYSKPYVQDYGLPDGQPMLHISEDLLEEPRRWWCYECQRSFVTSAQLQRHIDQYHTDDKNSMRRKYHCQHCTRTFIRLYSLKRHMASHRNMESDKIENSNKTDEVLNASLNLEDNRLPSDESLQNYTNMLDFSTNLFDTDRMPGLDISGSSRSDMDFNPYGISYRDELSHDLGFDKLSSDKEKPQIVSKEQENQQTQANSEPMLISCHYCKQTILREKKRQHLSICTEKRFDCECGRKFTSNEKYTQHIQTEHSSSTKTQDETNTEFQDSNTLEYKCDKCEHVFKRRGMLVNHLWRAHRSRAPVPLERRVRHYPCAVCPKLYRTAAKRDVHHKAHHPGVVDRGRYSIESGRRSVAPASCTACPRQYATRAKLLQHQRQCHPDLAPPPKKPNKQQSEVFSTA